MSEEKPVNTTKANIVMGIVFLLALVINLSRTFASGREVKPLEILFYVVMAAFASLGARYLMVHPRKGKVASEQLAEDRAPLKWYFSPVILIPIFAATMALVFFYG